MNEDRTNRIVPIVDIFHSTRGYRSGGPSILRISIRYSNNTDTRSNQYLNGANVQYHGFNLAKYTSYFRINSFISDRVIT